ncbi:MAG: phosphate/phosphite/phosphonate ABC transporter substrate-binding protein, partial [Byssovorax sp.]
MPPSRTIPPPPYTVPPTPPTVPPTRHIPPPPSTRNLPPPSTPYTVPPTRHIPSPPPTRNLPPPSTRNLPSPYTVPPSRTVPPPSRSVPQPHTVPPSRPHPSPSHSASLPRRGISPTRAPSSLVVLFPPSLGKSKSAARAELLQLALAHELDIPVTIRVTASYKELETRTRAGEAHIVWAPAGVCAKLENFTRAIYKAVRQGASTYRSAIVAHREPSVSLEHLEGLRAAWVDPYSIGGYLLAADFLRRHGAEPDRVFVQQTFHRSHSDALYAVTGGAADISAVTAWSDDPRSLRDALTLHIGPIERKITVLAVTDAA